MNSGRFVLSQVLDQVHRQALERCAQRYNANDRVRHFGCRQQFTAMVCRATLFRGNGAGTGTNYFVSLGTGDRA